MKRRNVTVVTAVAIAAVKAIEIAEIRTGMHTMHIGRDWQKGVNKNHLEIGHMQWMIDEIVKCHHNEIEISDGRGHHVNQIDLVTLEETDLVISDANIPALAPRPVTETYRTSDGKEAVRPGHKDNHHLAAIEVEMEVMQVEIVQLITTAGIAVDPDLGHQDENQTVDIHGQSREVVHIQNNGQMIRNRPTILGEQKAIHVK